jgi:HPt (histidine-containing phosphotransfer) domain-containing protein
LHVIAKQPSKKVREAVQKGKAPEFGNFSEILYAFLGGQEEHLAGTRYDFTRMERKDAPAEMDFPAAYPSFALDGRLAPSQDAADFFGEDGSVGAEASPRLRGIVLHDILSEVRTPEDLDAAVAAGDAKAAFEAAHGLKGAVGNLALTPIYTPISAITERLRGQSEMCDISALHAEANKALAELRRIAK